MPELPEVETVVRDLRPLLEGRRFSSVSMDGLPLRRRWSQEWEQLISKTTVQEIHRRGKWIVIVLNKGMRLLFHLGMTGQLMVVPSKQEKLDHTHLVITLDRGGKELRFRDVRRFGSATLFASEEELQDFFQKSGLGPEPFALDGKYFRRRLEATQRCLKAILLDQKIVAGIGNIYADEALFESRLHPAQLGKDTTKSQADRLRKALVTVLNRAIEYRGSTIKNYLGGSGLQGKYQDEFSVYGRQGAPCKRCNTQIQRIRLAGRSTHFCPRCQKL